MNKTEPTLDDVRRAAAQLATSEAEDLFSIVPIEKRALAAIFERAFPDQPPRGLTYAEEIGDLCDWLGSLAVDRVDEGMDRDQRLLAMTASYMSVRCKDGNRRGEAAIELVRAVATYFLRIQADLVADIALDDAACAVGGHQPEGGRP